MTVGWREWLTKRAHTWAAMVLSLLTVALVTGAALVGATADPPPPTDGSSVVVDEPAEGPTGPTGATGAEGHDVVNHGRCVSQAVQAAKDAGLHGKAKGAFVNSIASDESLVAPKDEPGDQCDFAEALAAAVAAQQEAEQAETPKKQAPAKEPKEHPAKGPKHEPAPGDEPSAEAE